MSSLAAKMQNKTMDWMDHPAVKQYCSWKAAMASASVPHKSRVRAGKKGSTEAWRTRRKKYGNAGHAGEYKKREE